jgi:hypothetical protein
MGSRTLKFTQVRRSKNQPAKQPKQHATQYREPPHSKANLLPDCPAAGIQLRKPRGTILHHPIMTRTTRFGNVVAMACILSAVASTQAMANTEMQMHADSLTTSAEAPGGQRHIQHAIWQLLPVTFISILTCIYDETTRTWIRRQRVAMQPPWNVIDVYPNGTVCRNIPLSVLAM